MFNFQGASPTSEPPQQSRFSSELCYYTKPPPFCQHLFSIFFPFLSPLLQLLRVLLLSAFFFIWFLPFHVVVILISCTIYSFSLPFLLFVDISWFCFLCCFFIFSARFFYQLYVSLYLFSRTKPPNGAMSLTLIKNGYGRCLFLL